MSNTATRFRVYRRGQVDCDASFSTLAGAMDWAIQHCRTVNEMAVLYEELIQVAVTAIRTAEDVLGR